jgi:hypothetical protein
MQQRLRCCILNADVCTANFFRSPSLSLSLFLSLCFLYYPSSFIYFQHASAAAAATFAKLLFRDLNPLLLSVLSHIQKVNI